MQQSIGLCLDSASLTNPRMLGLPDIALGDQSWLALYCSGLQARRELRRAATIREVWVSSSDDVDMVNLAAAIKRDNPQRKVSCIVFHPDGSTLSRCHAAGIDRVMNKVEFLRCFEEEKNRHTSYERHAYERAIVPGLRAIPAQSDIRCRRCVRTISI